MCVSDLWLREMRHGPRRARVRERVYDESVRSVIFGFYGFIYGSCCCGGGLSMCVCLICG